MFDDLLISRPHAAMTATTSDAAVDTLIVMTDEDVRKHVGECFVAQLRVADSALQGTFFAGSHAPPVPLPPGNQWVGGVAVALVAWAMSQTSQHGFARCVDDKKAKAEVNAKLTPSNDSFKALAKANYDALFPTYCKAQAVTFQSFLVGQNASTLGTALANTIKSDAFISKEMLTFAADPAAFYQKIALLLYKIQRLNPGEFDAASKCWKAVLQNKGLESPWTIYQYMQSDRFSEQTFLQDVLSAINQQTVTATRPTYTTAVSSGPGGAPSTDTRRGVDVPSQYTYGIRAAQWLNGARGAYPTFFTGNAPGNVEDVPGARGCCFVRGTPVLLADGASKSIEEVSAGEALLGKNGVAVHRSTHDVTWDLEDGELIYGINDIPPFFNASHPFLTRDGWKAISPSAAKRINPHLQIGRLAVGDTLYRVRSTDPFAYEEVEISTISQKLGDPSEKIFSIDLRRENLGYHAHGFCVAVNYPVLTEDSFATAFARLSAAERKLIYERLGPILPLLRSGMGNFVQQALERALGAR
jgi:hypothetical protein